MNSRDYWFDKIRVCRATVDGVERYYLTDAEFNFLPYAKEYIDMHVAAAGVNTSPNTLRTYCYGLRYFFIFLAIKGKTIKDTDGDHSLMIEYKLWLQNPFRFDESVMILPCVEITKEYSEDLLSISTLNQYMSTIAAFYNWMVASKIIKVTPISYRLISAPKFLLDRDILAHTHRKSRMAVNALKTKAPKRRPKTLSESDFQAILACATSKRNKLMLLIMKEGGVRLGELLGIRLEDIDFGNCGVWIKFRPDNSNRSRAKAGVGNDRFLTLTESLMALMDNYIATDWLSANATSDFLFVVTDCPTREYYGNPLTESAVHSIFDTISKQTGIHINPHMLRHTHTTELARRYIANGEEINWKLISVRLGHKSVTTETYAHLSAEDYKKEYNRVYSSGVNVQNPIKALEGKQ